MLERRRRGEEQQVKQRDRLFWLRNILNFIFVIGAIVGLIFYFAVNHNTGTIIILSAMAFKIAEYIIRLLKL